jgi:hypothetical protein
MGTVSDEPDLLVPALAALLAVLACLASNKGRLRRSPS